MLLWQWKPQSGEEVSWVEDLICAFYFLSDFFFFMWSASLIVALEAYSMTGLGQNMLYRFWVVFSPCYLFLMKCGIRFLKGKNKPDET